MTAYLRNPLTIVWAFLSFSTVVSWALSRDVGGSAQMSALVTTGVLLIAAVKAQFVIRYFMEVRHAPAWLQRTLNAWLILLFAFLLGAYFAGL
ncbi:cytochrome C oxidase subunit IV family protein [Solimonas terrae]|uniref:Cytochrome C oxidase subunit IV family protein n=1 Tax=Solimonas terrae TaxID=1396819 RepID=A0A6M2BSK2_9GAMM|nr:cytochrome C oxidase subunit IV family protein [Solimonas terrae]NGY04999.1 cytochrome C oxidase subunit IV family protein [Solimonas terrae]